MNKDLNQLKDQFDEFLSTKQVFTDEDKIRIRRKISQTKNNHRYSKSLIPNLLTACLLLIGVFFTGNLLMENLHFSQHESSMPETARSGVETRLYKTEDTASDTYGSTEKSESIFLTEDLLAIFTQYANSKDEEVLRGIRPLDIFKFYYYAEYLEDYETQYSFFITDEYLRAFPTLEDFVEAIESQSDSERRQFIEEKILHGEFHEVINNEDGYASISILLEPGLSFGLTLNEKGIWKVNWLPFQ
ncbi:hypothetical protein DS745_20015 [Anaerobacillus alkaliphilus]|uniref:Uncharacterized protein n=1 Tax=Anaerobacillus alkaliphilus TaxID=1548597 RepID=A0A4V1LG57_9BACI|nr:hypothetical protein [Anaerobacillus alkaliphilus]RXI98604.1 hypothetical protein DS745_20015 [Anaerobacillus alkaliphilus]